ncbi:chromatin modification-related protein EAF1 B-like protein isoform X1 [Cinnamomum micranthum f. kanehirae]|uniref:Chromatin modification-related protein EAF1 B-like protein isoform X1 n=1 Tax=Cinnamomum micranthum f. kanehirae TaxID=337451 RepID=A0A3S3NPJ4_9MAGN|nr:chromatin modification-related protein EAF1 B-like protein isoform X1 [Cinnamomum micranthum f. kanehirae]
MGMPAGQSVFGNPWSVYEDQALVVLVHDMGPNWELVSDAINSTLQFKCIFRKPKECKERHKELMDRNDDDEADSAEDSRSPQHYPSTLPGIPKACARQLLQRLHGPMEEDTLKGHFKKIIRLGQLLHSCRSQATSQRLSIGMTPKNLRLPNHGETLLSVHGSPLGVYREDNMEAIHESKEG